MATLGIGGVDDHLTGRSKVPFDPQRSRESQDVDGFVQEVFTVLKDEITILQALGFSFPQSPEELRKKMEEDNGFALLVIHIYTTKSTVTALRNSIANMSTGAGRDGPIG